MCRSYSDRDVPQEKLDRILDLACRYPSAGHTEPQEFVVVRDRWVKEALARAALGQMFVAQAPLVIVVVSDTRRSARRYGARGVHFYSIIDGAFVAMLILLAAEEGLGACFVAAFHDREVQEVLGLPPMFALSGSCPSVTASRGQGGWRADPRRGSSTMTGTEVNSVSCRDPSAC